MTEGDSTYNAISKVKIDVIPQKRSIVIYLKATICEGKALTCYFEIEILVQISRSGLPVEISSLIKFKGNLTTKGRSDA